MENTTKIKKIIEKINNKRFIGKEFYIIGGLTVLTDLSRPRIKKIKVINAYFESFELFEENIKFDLKVKTSDGFIFNGFNNLFETEEEAENKLKEIKQELLKKLQVNLNSFEIHQQRRLKAIDWLNKEESKK